MQLSLRKGGIASHQGISFEGAETRGKEYSCHFLNLWWAADWNNGLGSLTTCELAPDFCWEKMIPDLRWLKLCKGEDWIAKMENLCVKLFERVYHPRAETGLCIIRLIF